MTLSRRNGRSLRGDCIIIALSRRHGRMIVRGGAIFGHPPAGLWGARSVGALPLATLDPCLQALSLNVATSRRPLARRLRMQEKDDVTSSTAAASFNLAKGIVGAGSFALPYVCKNEGIIGGLLTIVACAVVSTYTMESLIDSKNEVESRTGRQGLSYVETTRLTLGQTAAQIVFALSVLSSLLICGSYVAFTGSTLATMVAQPGNVIHDLLQDLMPTQDSTLIFQEAMIGVVLPISMLKEFGLLSFTSFMGVVCVILACSTLLVDGLLHKESLDAWIHNVQALPLWPASSVAYFQSFGSVVFLFCVNFLIFPIEAKMSKKAEWRAAVQRAVQATAVGNMLFAGLGYSLYGEETSEIVLNNLGPGALLSAVKILVCLDLILTYPLVLASATNIIDTALLRASSEQLAETLLDGSSEDKQARQLHAAPPAAPTSATASPFVSPAQAGVRAVLVALTFAVAQAKGFQTITNVAGGLAQGLTALVFPQAILLHLKSDSLGDRERGGLLALIAFGLFSAGITSYLALAT